MSSTDFRTPSFTWESHRRERWTWRSIGVLLVIAVGAGFYIGRLSIAAPALTELAALNRTDATPGQTATPADTTAQRQGAVQPDAATATVRFSGTSELKPEVKAAEKEGQAAPSTETAKAQPAATAARETSSPPVVLINPKATDKSSDSSAPKQLAPTTEPNSTANASAKTETQKIERSPPTALGKQQAKARQPAHANTNVPPARPDSVVVRRDDAYVPPRIPQAAYPEQRERYDDDAYRGDDRRRFEPRYPDRRYVEDGPPPRAYDGYDDRRDYVRPYQDFRYPREYRRFGGYDGPYEAERPLLRPMNGRDY